VLIRHDRRVIQHIVVTAHPTAEWVVQQLREATPFGEQPTYLLHDNDRIFVSQAVTRFLERAGIKRIRMAYQCPWQNGICERSVGLLRRELLDQCIPLNERHLRRLLSEYVRQYYHPVRTHQGIERQTPEQQESFPAPASLTVPLTAEPILGGLYHTYRRAA
jgi:transposase InsO family protein